MSADEDGSRPPARDQRESAADEKQDLVFVLGSSRRTDLAGVEDELGELWLTTGEEARLRGRGAVVRVRELNLVVYAAGEEMARQISDIVTRVAQCHPGRVIVLLDRGPGEGGEAATDEDLEAWVTAACYVTTEGTRQVCWEQITLPVSSESVDKLFAAAVPLVVPDLPIVIWWPGKPAVESRLFDRLVEIAERLIMDTAGYPHPLQGLREVQELALDPERDYLLQDLNWTRLSSWREMIAEPFDDPARISLLRRVRRVSVAYSGQGDYGLEPEREQPAASRALLLAGWLASRLGWEVTDGGWSEHEDGALVRMKDPSKPEREIELFMRPRVPAVCAGGGLGEVEITFDDGPDGDSCIVVSRSPDTCVCAARVRHGGRESVVRTVEMQHVSEDQLLCDELDYLGQDEVYEESLAIAVQLGSLRGGELLWS